MSQCADIVQYYSFTFDNCGRADVKSFLIIHGAIVVHMSRSGARCAFVRVMDDETVKPQSKPFLLVITGPILRFLANKKLAQDEDGNMVPAKPMAYWPFGIA